MLDGQIWIPLGGGGWAINVLGVAFFLLCSVVGYLIVKAITHKHDPRYGKMFFGRDHKKYEAELVQWFKDQAQIHRDYADSCQTEVRGIWRKTADWYEAEAERYRKAFKRGEL